MAVDPNIYRSARFTPEQARKLLAEAHADPLFLAAWRDKSHVLHERYVTHRHWLHEVIAGEPAPAGSTPSPWPSGKIPEIRIIEARNDPAYRDKGRPNHGATVAAASAAYAELYPEGGER